MVQGGNDDYSVDFRGLQIIGWIIIFIIFMTIAALNADGIPNKIPIYIFAILSFVTCIVIPYITRTDPFLGKIIDDEEYEESDRILIALKRSGLNVIVTLIYFGFIVNAIARKMKTNTTFSSLKQKPSTTGEGWKQFASNIGSNLSTVVYMAIFLVLINVFSTGYIYYNCEDKNSDVFLRSLINAQYNIIIITVMGVITFVATKKLKK